MREQTRPTSSPQRRLHFREHSAEEQVERAVFEIVKNFDFYMQLNHKRRVRKVRVDAAARRRAVDSARRRVCANLATVPQLRPLRTAAPADAQARV